MTTFNTVLRNREVANLGKVKFTFDDGSEVAKDIQTIGEFVFDENSTRQPIQIDALNQSWQVAAVSSAGAAGSQVNYPNGQIGHLTQRTIQVPGSDTPVFYIEMLDHN